MTTYRVVTYIGGSNVYNRTLKGYLYCENNYYKIIDENSKSHYFPIQYTIIDAI